MTEFCKVVCALLLTLGMVMTDILQYDNSATEIKNECSPEEADDIKIVIYSRRNKTGQLYAQVKLQEGSSKKRSWQVDIDHDSSCGSSSGEWSRNIRRSPLNGIGNPESPRPLYEFVHGLGYYKLHNRPKIWYEAKRTCETEGAHLAIINSVEEAQLLMELYDRIPKMKDEYNFIGVEDTDEDGTWLTIFGESLNETGFTGWNSGEPSRPLGENCVGLKSDVGKMHAIRCTDSYGFYCEREL